MNNMTNKQLGYMPDLSKISLKEFRNELKTGRLLPSRKPLLDDIDAKFSLLEKEGLVNASSLKVALNSSSKIKQLAQKTGISENYFQLLKREANNLLPTPIKFTDIPNVSKKIVKKLTSLNIINTEDLFLEIKDTRSRKEFEKKSGLSIEEVLWLTQIVDVSRIKWVGPKLARLIVDTKYNTVHKLAEANPAEVLNALNEAKIVHKAYQGALGINDIDSWIRQVIKKTPLVIEY
jgi:hypothetical protein